jgi:DMSO reductase family type II enzyme heme b subunit
MNNGRGKLVFCLSMALWAAAPALAKPGDADKGGEIYARRCVLCHGEEGDGLGAAAERLNPPPRDFSLGQYKIKTTGFDDIVPNDSDLFRMINDGMPATAMPGWGDLLSEQDIWDLIAHIKIFAGLEAESPSQQVDYGTQVASSPESIARGKELFHAGDRCSECHGEDGKGDAVKGLKDDSGFRTWPRNLTKPWTFRASNDAKDIYTRISTGIPGTQMPSFADPTSNKKLESEERWHVANYVNSLAKSEEVVRPENTVVKAAKLDGDLPGSPQDERWTSVEPTSFFLVPQIIAAERHFTPSNDTITVRALYNDDEVAFLLEWDDRTRSIPGDETAEKISDAEISEDAVAIQLPVKLPKGSEKPYFFMGDAAHPVSIWRWKSGTTDAPASVSLMNSRGIDDVEERDAASLGIQAKGGYERGTWRVVVKRALTTADPEQDIQFVEGAFIPVAFAAWDGSNSESGSRHTLTTWYWLLLKPASGNTPLLAAVAAFVLVLLAEFWWVRSASRKARTA